MTPLLDALLDLLAGWRTVFPQQRTFARSTRLALAQVLAPGCRTISRIIAACGLASGIGVRITGCFPAVRGSRAVSLKLPSRLG